MPVTDTSPFDDIRALAASLPGPDPAAAEALRLRLARIVPEGLGRVNRVAEWAATWQGRASPSADRALVCVFASSHGVAARLGRGDPAAATRRRLDAFAAGGTPTNAACATSGLGFRAFDLALDLPTDDIARAPAMSERDCVATMAFGMESVAGGADLLAIAGGSFGGDVPAAAILCALFGDPPSRWCSGREPLDLVTEALLRHGRQPVAPLAILASLGGRDVAALAGAILAARSERVPVILDGLVALAAAAILHALEPGAISHCLAAQDGADPALLERLGLEALLTGLDLPDGEGLGAALALGLAKTMLTCAREPRPPAR